MMPTLITYERKRLTEGQLHALRRYISRKRLKEEKQEDIISANGGAGDVDHLDDEQNQTNNEEAAPHSPPEPSARQLLEEKQRVLKDGEEHLAELESLLTKLKDKKHELFEELKTSLKNKEERERQMQGFPSPFMQHAIAPGAPMMNVSPYRPGMKRPKSPSPPLVQLYSPLSATTNPHKSFPSMGNRMPGLSDNMNPGYQFQHTGLPQPNVHQPAPGPRMNPLPSSPRPFQPFGTSQMSDPRMSVPHQSPPRPPLPTQPPLRPQNMANTTNENAPGFSPPGKDRQGFSNPSVHRPPGYVKRDSHTSTSRPRYY